MHLTTNVLGSFVAKNGKIIKEARFPSEPEEVARRLGRAGKSLCDEERKLIEELIATGNRSVHVLNTQRFMGSGLDITFLEEEDRIPVYRIAADRNIDKHQVDNLIRKVNRILVAERLKEVDRDQVLIQAVDSLDDMDEAINRLVERLREWYSLHFPELDPLVVAHDTYAKLVIEAGKRDAYGAYKLSFDAALNDKILRKSKDSLGVEFSDLDIEAVRVLSRQIVSLHKSKEEIEAYIGGLMTGIAPNINALTGPLLGARLISLAHGLNRLATLPAGTIQLLGAEDAFFRFLKSGKNPPKHGVIFQLPAIRGAARNKRGKIARTFAAKVALASRADAFHGEYIGDRLKADMEKRIASIK